ncbi:MAG: extracellular solute-binding protein [Planctomycetota bacterium]|nr:extracellular solute-binding protein [Planctomycetota bacterium]
MARPGIRKRRVQAWVYGPEHYREIFAPVMRRHPEVEWDVRAAPGGHDQAMQHLVKELQAPWTPLALFPVRAREMTALARRGWLRDLAAIVPPRARMPFAHAALDLCSRGGTLYALPEDATPYSLMLREDLMQGQKARPRTWDELERLLTWFAARQRTPALRAQEGGPTHRYGFLVALLASNGVDCSGGLERIARDRARLLEAYAWMRRMAEQRLINYPADLYPEKTATMDLFRDGRVALVFGWPSGLRAWPAGLAAKARTLPFPSGPSAGVPGRAVNGTCWCVPHNTASLDIAAELLEAATAPETMRRFELLGGTAYPARKELWADREVLAKKPYYRDAAAALEGGRVCIPDFFDPDLRRLEETFCEALAQGRSGEDWLRMLTNESNRLVLRTISDEVVRQATSFIEEKLAEIHSVTQVAAAVRRNPDHVNRLFQRELKVSCHSYLARRRMERAKDLVSDLTLSIKEIAGLIGVESATTFNRLCRQQWGCSALQMRKRELARIKGRPDA